jgi:hypothetical protein
VGGKWQSYVGMGMEFPWVLAWLSLAAGSRAMGGDWRWLQWATSAPGLPAALAIAFFLPENPRWLFTAGHTERAQTVLEAAASVNGRPLKEGWKLQPMNLNNNRQYETKGSILDIFKRRALLAKAVILFANWFANSFVYYGLTLNSGNLGGSYELNFVINGLLELPAYSISLLVILKYKLFILSLDSSKRKSLTTHFFAGEAGKALTSLSSWSVRFV